MDLLEVRPQLNLHDDAWPLRSERRALAPARFVLDGAGRRGMAIDSEVCGGCIVSGATVRRSWLSFNVSVEQGSLLEACVVLPGVHIGRSVVLRHCVVEQGCRLPEGFVAGVDPAHDAARFHVTERGVTLITLQSLGQLPQPRCCGDAVALQ